jgi:hypothetical protein
MIIRILNNNNNNKKNDNNNNDNNDNEYIRNDNKIVQKYTQ